MPTIDVQRVHADTDTPADADLARYAEAALADWPEAEITLRLVDAAESRALNHTWRGKDRPTNVLSFPAGADPELSGGHIGDLVLCVPVIAAEAAGQGKPPAAHWAHMVVHGMLHLLGHDHICDKDAAVMEAREIELLAGLGFPDPYQAR